MGDRAQATEIFEDLGDIFCLTFVKGVSAEEALRRMGAYPDTLASRTGSQMLALTDGSDPGRSRLAAAIDLGLWSVVIEPNDFQGIYLVEEVSSGTEALSVLRHDYALPQVGYAADGAIVGAFDPDFPRFDEMEGADPERLHPFMRAAGFVPYSEEASGDIDDGKSLLMAMQFTGTTLPLAPLDDARLSAVIEPWFVRLPNAGDRLSSQFEPQAADLVKAAERADPRTQRAVAVEEVGRLASLLNIANTPGFAEVLGEAAAGVAQPITVSSPLAPYIREWLERDRRSGLSLEQQALANRYGWFLTAFRGVLDPDPRRALLAALRPVGSEPALFGGRAARMAVLDAMTRSA